MEYLLGLLEASHLPPNPPHSFIEEEVEFQSR